MTAVKRFRSAVILHRPSPTVRYGALGPPVGGTFHFENLLMPPLPNTCPKMVPSDRGGSLCVKDAFAKKIFGAGRDSAGGALASVLRKHSSEGRTPDAVVHCVRQCAGVSPSKGDRDLPPPIQNVLSRRFFDVDFVELFRRSCKPVLKVCKFGSSNSARTHPELTGR